MSRSRALAEASYPLGAVARLTGVSPQLLRAWERRYGVVEPIRSPGGTRRYRAADLERLRLVKAAVDAGHRIGQVAGLDTAELRRRAKTRPGSADRLEAVLAALESLDGVEAQRLLSLQLSALGPTRFAREIALPLIHEIGERWANERMEIAAERLASAVLRSLLGAALQPTAVSLRGPRIVFATPSGEPHELGLLIAAVTAHGAGANLLYLGTGLPAADLVGAATRAGAAALALSIVTLPTTEAGRTVAAVRAGLPARVRLWLGGSGAGALEVPDGVERIPSLDALEQHVSLLGLDATR